MSNFYGINNNIPLTPFVFDIVWETTGDIKPITDNVFIGRYGYCKQDQTVYQKYRNSTGELAYRKITVLQNTKILLSVFDSTGQEYAISEQGAELSNIDITDNKEVNITANLPTISWMDLDASTPTTLEFSQEEYPVAVE